MEEATAPVTPPQTAPAPSASTRPRWQTIVWRSLREALIVGSMLMIYKLGRGFVEGDYGLARGHALWLIGIEEHLGIFHEAAWQDWTLARPTLAEFFDLYYEWVHFPATGLFLIYVFWRHGPNYARVRNSMAVATLVAFVIHWKWPLMPPRMMPEYGFHDTVAAGIYSDAALGGLTNQIAAMPSLHFGWALTISVALIVLGKSRWNWLWASHAILTLLAITVTANHFFLDAVGGAAVMGVGFWVTTWKPLGSFAPVVTPKPEPVADE